MTLQLANKAVKLAANDSFALSMLGAAHTLVREFKTAYELLQRALELDPNCAWGWNRLGWLNSYLDRPTESIECFEKAIRLSPLDPINFNCFAGLGAAHFLQGRHDESVKWLEKALAANPEARWIYRPLIPAYVFAGRMDEAKRGLRLLIEDYPSLTCEKVRVRHALFGTDNGSDLRRPRTGWLANPLIEWIARTAPAAAELQANSAALEFWPKWSWATQCRASAVNFSYVNRPAPDTSIGAET